MNLTDEELKTIVTNSISFCDACRKAGKKPRGSTLQFFTKRIRRIGLDTSHFLGKAAHAGPRQTGICRKKHWSEVLISSNEGRERSVSLRKSFEEFCEEKHIPIICKGCSRNPDWMGKFLKLEIDHIDEVNSNNTPTNLQWLCPNCHSQKTFTAQ